MGISDSITIAQKWLGASFMAVITGLIGGWDLSLQVLLVAVVIDISSGIYKGWKNKEIQSKRIREGLMTKSAYLLVLVITYQFDLLVGNTDPVFRTVVAWLYIFTETVSIFENLYAVGIPIPKKLYEVLLVVKDKTGGFMDDDDFADLNKKTSNGSKGDGTDV